MEQLFVVSILFLFLTTSRASDDRELESLTIQIEENIPTHKCNQTLENLRVSFSLRKMCSKLPANPF